MTVSASRWTARRLARGRAAALLVLMAILAGAGVRAFALRVSPAFSSDSFQTLLIARSLVEGRGFSSGGAEHADLSRMVLFPAAIGVLSEIVGDVELAAKVAIVLAGALVVVPLFLFCRSAFGPRAAVAALPLGALSCLVGASLRVLVTPLYVLVVTTIVATLWFAARRGSRRLWIASGALVGLAALTRPEGVAFAIPALAWALRDPSRPRPGARTGASERWAAAGLIVASFLLVYGPYVGWASLRLGRFMPSPGIEYVLAERGVSDRFLLREIASPVKWTSRARFMLTADHRELLLERYFLTGRFPAPDGESLGLPDELALARLTASGRPEDVSWRQIVRRRWNIVRGNMALMLRKAVWGHFTPAVVVVLCAGGLFPAWRSRRGRSALGLLALSGVASLAPMASHVEDRFLYTPFVFALGVAAAGWGALSAGLASLRWPRIPRRAVTATVHLVAIGAVGLAGIRHEGNRSADVARQALLRRSAKALGDRIPQGAVLAIDPHFPYWAVRPYRPIPYASVQGILDYARAQHAGFLVIEGERDLSERPDLAWLAGPGRPAPFRVAYTSPHPWGGTLLVLEIPEDGMRQPPQP